MPPSDFKLPDDFPDLTLPEKTERAPEPFRPLVQRPAWREGDRVLAPWEPQFLYAGMIRQIREREALIAFDDGDAGWVLLDQIRPFLVQTGQAVLGRRKMGPHFFPGRITEVHHERVLIRFDDGQEEWTTVAALRIPCQAIGPAAAPTTVASHLKFYENLQPGDRVWAPWNAGTLFVGTVDEVQEKEVHIHFDDGDRGWVLREQVLPLEIPVGLRVMGRWKMGTAHYPGTVAEVQGDRIHIHYDDGDKEWTKPAALAVPCQPFGPDARPTRHATRWQPLSGWLIPIGIGLALAFMRASCR